MKNLLEFFRKNFKYFLFVVLELVCIVLIYNNMSYPHFKLAKASQVITGPVYTFRHAVVRHFYYAKENEDLAEQNISLLRENSNNFLEESDTVISVFDTTSSKKKRIYDYTFAHVIHNSTYKKYNYIIIDKGQKDGITPDMAVLSSRGVVGAVSNVSENFASVIPLLHADSRLSARLPSINQIGTIVWEEGDPLHSYLVDIPQHLAVNIGDSVLTSGYSNVFPKDILIGTVSEIDNSQTSFLKIQVELATSFNNLNTVYVVKNLYKDELDTLKASFKNE